MKTEEPEVDDWMDIQASGPDAPPLDRPKRGGRKASATGAPSPEPVMSYPAVMTQAGLIPATNRGGFTPVKIPKAPNLKSVADVRKDLIRVYRAARNGNREAEDQLGKMAYSARQITALFEVDQAERLKQLEDKLERLLAAVGDKNG